MFKPVNRNANGYKVILSGGTSHTPKIAQRIQSLFSLSTTVISPSTSTTAINPSDLAARGAAIQASLIQEFEKEDIEQSTHPMVTATPHLRNAIGVQLISSREEQAVFRPLVNPDTAVPARRGAQYKTPKEGGNIIIRVCEGTRHIKVTKPAPKEKTNGAGSDGDDSDLDEDEEEEDIREKVWRVGKALAEFPMEGVKKGSKIEVMVNVGGDMSVQITAREVGGKGGVRGTLEAPQAVENGKA